MSCPGRWADGAGTNLYHLVPECVRAFIMQKDTPGLGLVEANWRNVLLILLAFIPAVFGATMR
ncbi:hypothetical protein ZHAS_00002123 [Anopheles sinensis]|uniref:Uncharacterized protein n=1 Tax=Anopheles sinensis TaxID=74873 RepID=A0A084VBT5_ANOSI|nr:hypothetical protein ZHAS_00002123 [Anopheles sinensis]